MYFGYKFLLLFFSILVVEILLGGEEKREGERRERKM